MFMVIVYGREKENSDQVYCAGIFSDLDKAKDVEKNIRDFYSSHYLVSGADKDWFNKRFAIEIHPIELNQVHDISLDVDELQYDYCGDMDVLCLGRCRCYR